MTRQEIHINCTRHLEPEAFAEALEYGIRIDARDFLSIEIRDPSEFYDTINLNSDPLVFTSMHGVEAMRLFKHRFPKIGANNTCFCINGSTRQKALEAGYTVIGSAPDGNSLAACIAASGVVSVLHCSTEMRRNELQTGLQTAGIAYRACLVYNKTVCAHECPPADGVMFYSPSQADAYLNSNLLNPETPAFCIGHTTAEYLRQKGHRNLHIAAKADTAHILQTIYQYYNQEHE